jgi:hypothetical protein
MNSPGTNKGRVLAADETLSEEEGEKEDEFDERHSDQHSNLELADSLWLSAHSVHSSESDQTEADPNSEHCDSVSNEVIHGYFFSCFLVCSYKLS